LTSNLFPFSKSYTQLLILVLRQKHPKILNKKKVTHVYAILTLKRELYKNKNKLDSKVKSSCVLTTSLFYMNGNHLV